MAARLALACECRINPWSDFDRKNYFYADLPKGYQITQHRRPLASGGFIDIPLDDGTKRIQLDHMHLEEDPGKSKQEGGVWLVDMNRCGVPLVEIVSRPELRSASEAVAFVSEFRRIIRYLSVSDGNMEMGNMRCDANVSVNLAGADSYGTKTEIKNLNSFKFLEEAVNWEIDRQIQTVERGDTISQVTIHWDERSGEGHLSREKETEADYRYFREPNLIPVNVTRELVKEAATDLPELPLSRLRRYVQDFDLPVLDAQTLVEEMSTADYFESVVDHFDGPPKRASDWVRNHVLRTLNDASNPYSSLPDLPIGPADLAELLNLIGAGTLSDSLGTNVFEKSMSTGVSPAQIVEEEELSPPADDTLFGNIEAVIAGDPDTVSAVRGGNQKAVGRLIGQAMKLMQGRADANKIRDLLLERIGSD
jgi:aspartyl-tRNA(Asn)/glutamyl-tRNA(Gln) amidotransferase subunit B